MRARVDRFGHVSAGIETKLVIVRAADHVVLIGRVDRDRRLVAGTLLLAIGVDVRARLERRRADEISRLERRTAAEHGARNGRRSVEHVVTEVDRLIFLAKDGRQARTDRERDDGRDEGTQRTRTTNGTADVRCHVCAFLVDLS